MNERVKKILSMIEEARLDGELGNDQARAASVALELEGNEAMLACRLIAQGADPASLDYLDAGDVDPKLMAAHRNGPGVYEVDDPKLLDYMALCALSEDESQQDGSTLRGRFWRFFHALQRLNHPDEEFREAALDHLGAQELTRIRNLPYTVATVGGRSMRVYTSDRGFAAATWDGEACAATFGHYDGKPYFAVGAPPESPPLSDLGVEVDKPLSPRFGIVEDEAKVAAIREEAGL